ncbi:MAG: hydroxyacid dehydrogenase [Microvirga sp.]|jgi:phosphoglycerate dehydrogenase-like enzyme|nr:hydroxyacid dehydrogenase [Microvirga sp.]
MARSNNSALDHRAGLPASPVLTKKGLTMLPPKNDVTVCCAHPAYQMHNEIAGRKTGIRSFQVHSREELPERLQDADVLVISGFWRNDLLEVAPKLKFIQSIGAGTDQFDRDLLRQRGVRLASAQGVNERAVSQHAMALILAMARRLPEARDNQAKHAWRGMISDLDRREDELTGKTLLIIGLGRIGGRLAGLAKAFDMEVIGVRRDPAAGANRADSVHRFDRLPELLPRADFVALTCPLTPETQNIIDAVGLARMKPSAVLVNAARGRCVDEAALVEALRQGQISGAALDVTVEEPLAPGSPLWDMPNVFITPHTAGETRRYEANVVDILVENLERLWRGEAALRNQIV